MDPKAQKILITLGARIREKRKKLSMTQDALSANAQLHRSYLADIEGGRRNVTTLNLCRLATGLHLTVAELFDGLDTTLTSSEVE